MIYHDTLICYNIWPLFANHCLDFSKEYYGANGVERLHDIDKFVPEDVKENDIVFVKTDFIVNGHFYHNYFQRIKNKFKLITANSAYQIGSVGDDSYKYILGSDKLIKWFCTNPPNTNSNKIIPIPIGFEEQNRIGGNQMFLNKMRSKRRFFWDKNPKIFLPYHNFETNSKRKNIYDSLMLRESVCGQKEKQNLADYLSTINEYRFVICIEGFGFDIHRIYETLLMGSVPIIIDSTLEKMVSMYKFPCIIVKDWNNLDNFILEPYLSFPSPAESFFGNIGRFLYANSYKKLFLEGVW